MLTRRVTIILAITLVIGGACGGSDKQPEAAQTPTTIIRQAFNVGTGDPNMTPEEKLDQLLELPSTPGLVRGVVVSDGKGIETPSGGMFPTVWTDFSFRVTGWVGLTPNPYAEGSVITLRVPGGTTADGGIQAVTEHAVPHPSKGSVLYVLHNDHGTAGGGNSADRIIATIPQDIWPLTPDGRNVTGQGFYSNFKEPLAAFERHFRK